MTPYSQIYDAFLAKALPDDWSENIDLAIAEEDMRQILESAIPYFKFPRISLDRDATGFTNTLGTEEIQILGTLMKCEWLERTILSWENIKGQYDTKDFSQSNLLDKLTKLLQTTQKKANKLERIYYRAIKGKPYPYRKLAGGN